MADKKIRWAVRVESQDGDSSWGCSIYAKNVVALKGENNRVNKKVKADGVVIEFASPVWSVKKEG